MSDGGDSEDVQQRESSKDGQTIAGNGSSREDETKAGRVKSSDGAKVDEQEATEHTWRAVWDASSHRWYFWNAKTQQTTWDNPLEEAKGEQQAAEGSGRVSTDAQDTGTRLTDEELALQCGIDPDLAYLDPAMYAAEIQGARAKYDRVGASPSSRTPSDTYRAAGAFDSRTGKFVPVQHTGRGALHDPSRLTHANQADRQMSAFFDVEAHNEERMRQHRDAMQKRARQLGEEGTGGSGGKQRHDKAPPTRKELKMYKERAKEKKASKHAWLRE